MHRSPAAPFVAATLLALILAPTSALAQAAGQPADLDALRLAMRRADFDEAVRLAEESLAAGLEGADEAAYLRALALFHRGDHEQAAEAAATVAGHADDTPWLRKARFLEAAAHVRQGRFRDAETIYEEEAFRLLSPARKERTAGILIDFAAELATEPEPNDVGAPPADFGTAYQLYRQVLDMEIGRDLRDEVLYNLAWTAQRAGNHGGAVQHFREYLAGFDPDWMGPVGSPERLRGQKRENPPAPGRHVHEARYRLGKSLLATAQLAAARVNFEDLVRLLDGAPAAPENLKANCAWQIVRTWNLPQAQGNDLDNGLKAVRDFLADHPGHQHGVEAAWLVAEALARSGRLDEAVAACEAFIEGRAYRLPAGDKASEPIERLQKTPRELEQEWRQLAHFQIGQIRLQQQRFDDAVAWYQRYATRFPHGPHWSSAQHQIINAKYLAAIDALGDERTGDARELLAGFLESYPLDHRAPQVLFILGQIQHAEAERLHETADGPEADETRRGAARLAWEATIREWAKLISKYPGTEPAGLALFRTGLIYEERLDDLDEALAAYRKLTWSSYAEHARQRIAMMTGQHLSLRTERKFHTDEAPRVRLEVRNVETVTMRQYVLDPEAYFRKTHTLGGVDQLDIALIEPDRTWEVPIDGYRRYHLHEQHLDIPVDGNRPGVCIVNVSGDELEATTLVIRSDLDLIMRASRREALVFVQDMRTGRPAPGVEVLLSDGRSILAAERTGDDGVFRGRFDELERLDALRVFAGLDGHVASNALSLDGVQLTRGLVEKGYLYTDRPAYRPGQIVSARGVMRDVADGAYRNPVSERCLVGLYDPNGRLLHEEEVILNRFGAFDAAFPLDPAAPLGSYTIQARRRAEGAVAASGQFQVQAFQLRKMQLAFEFDSPVCFRGEVVHARVRAEYVWGEPARDARVRYVLPDGRQYLEPVGPDGTLELDFDTSGLSAGRALQFTASIEGEDVQTVGWVYMPDRAFQIEVESARELVVSGEPFDVTVRTKGPDGKPLGRALTLAVLHRPPARRHPVLDAVPWIAPPEPAAGEVTVREVALETDETTGAATTRLALDDGGAYVLRVTGTDRLDQRVVAERAVTVSDETDATRLRFFAETDRLKVGAETTVRLHSRLDESLALVTFEGETIIAHRVVPLLPGYNPIDVAVGGEHFPNFAISATTMDGRELFTASRTFTVERELQVTVRPLQDVSAPGASGQVELLVTDQLGRPVEAELSLALVDETLYGLFPETVPSILDFFQADARRWVDFRVAATNGFEYAATTCRVIEAFREEAERLVEAQEQSKALGEVRTRFAGIVDGAADRRDEAAAVRRSVAGRLAMEPAAAEGETAGDDNFAGVIVAGAHLFKNVPSHASGFAPIEFVAGPTARREQLDAGWWSPSIVTGADGRAVVDVPMPEKTARWRLTARGVSPETLVGQATATTITRQDFFVDLKMPGSLREGDSTRVVARIHNLTDYAGPVQLALTIASGERRYGELSARVDVEAGLGAETVFEEFLVPAVGELELTVSARAGAGPGAHADAMSRAVPVHPWGLAYADHGGGAATGSTALALELPRGMVYTSRWLTISVGPSVNQTVIDMALGTAPIPLRDGGPAAPAPASFYGGSAGSELLAAVSGLDYASAASLALADREPLRRRARSLISGLVVTQGGDGGWGWRGGDSDWSITAASYWGLSRARQLGLSVHAETLAGAERYLKQVFQSLPAADHDARAVILHALSENGKADFELANSIYRERQRLEPLTLAYAALTLANLDRDQMAGELLDLLEAKAERTRDGDRRLCRWIGHTERHPDLDRDLDTTSIALLALLEVRPGSPRVAEAVEYLLDRRGCFGYRSGNLRGATVRALCRYFARDRFAEDDITLSVLVNDRHVRTIEGRGPTSEIAFEVPADAVREGRNMVRFELEGRGRFAYAATLRGFSPQLRDPKSWNYPRVRSRRYLHAPLAYRGVPIAAQSTSPVEHVEIGQRVHVHVDFDETSRPSYMIVEEPLPAGFTLVPGSLDARVAHHEVRDDRLVLYYGRGQSVRDFSYQLVGFAPGAYRALPTVIHEAADPGQMRLGSASELTVLDPGEASGDPYEMNDRERYVLGKAYFDDGEHAEALRHLWPLFNREKKYEEREVARMLLWIHTTPEHFDATRVVQAFELLSVRHPQLTIPFDRILVVGQAYRYIGEFERAWLVYRATIDSSFLIDSAVSASLQDQGQLLGSIDFQEALWWEYPDTAEVATSHFALSQLLYESAGRGGAPAGRLRVDVPGRGPREAGGATRAELLADAIRLLLDFRTRYPADPLRDDAAFSLANAFLDLKDYEKVVSLSEAFGRQFTDSEFVSSFRYMEALGHFWQRHYDPALAAARAVADGNSRDRDFARYILGQIHHARGNPADAIEWYETVASLYPDAVEAIDYFRAKRIGLEEVSIFRPGEEVTLELEHRNIAEAQLQVYKVDLMKLYLREKNLSRITAINLAGIDPELTMSLSLGDGRDYLDRKTTAELDLEADGAYLVICRGDDLFASGLVLVTPLKVEVQEDQVSGRVRVNVIDEVEGLRPAAVHVKAIGSANAGFQSGETDLRGIFVADGVQGEVTVIARDEASRYAFHRGRTWVGAPASLEGAPDAARMQETRKAIDYQGNLRLQNDALQQGKNAAWDRLRRSGEKGVQVDKAR